MGVKQLARALAVLGFAVVILGCPGGPFGPEDLTVVMVEDDITTTTTWTSDNLYVVDQYGIGVYATLIIEPGTIIKFEDVDSGITLWSNGTIAANGTVEEPDWTIINNFFGSIDVGMNCVPSVCDVDMDGDYDVLCGNLSGSLTYFENQGGEWFQNNETFMGISGGQNTTPALADLDGDGDPDLTLGQYSGIFNYWVNHTINTGVGDRKMKSSTIASVYPNPINRFATIVMNDASASVVSVHVMNYAGQVLDQFTAKSKSSGKNNIEWNASGLNPGIYFIRLEWQNRSEVVKVIKM